MTPQQLEALPINGGFSVKEEIRAGQKCFLPVRLATEVLHVTEADFIFCDPEGQQWITGTAPDGRKMRQRVGFH